MRKQQTKQNRKSAKTSKQQTTNNARRSSRRCLGECSTEKWMSSNRTRPKTVFLTLTRTQDGYTCEAATILNRVNQFTAVPVEADIKALIKDINGRGLTA
jgi:hypothetical protein